MIRVPRIFDKNYVANPPLRNIFFGNNYEESNSWG